MLNDTQNIFSFPLTFEEIFANLSVALICSLVISFFYKVTFKGTSYTNSFVSSIVTLSMITAIIIMVIGNNLARAFGLVGAMSIIRFRTAIKDTNDIVFIFFSLSIGIASGVGMYVVSFTGTIFICLVIFVLTKLNYGTPRKHELLLQFTMLDGDENEKNYKGLFDKYCKMYKPINIKTSSDEDGLEVAYHIILKNKYRIEEFTKAFSTQDNIVSVNLYVDEE